MFSAQSTPTHTGCAGFGGPGVGVRQATWHAHRHAQHSHMPLPDRETSKVEKFKSIFSTEDLDLGESLDLSAHCFAM